MKGHTLPGPNQRATDPVTKKTQDNLNKNIQSGIKTKQESKVGAIGRRAGISGKGIQAILNVKPPKLKPISTTSMQKGFGEAINKALDVEPKMEKVMKMPGTGVSFKQDLIKPKTYSKAKMKKSPTKHRLTKRVPLNVDFDRLPKSYPRDRAVVIEHDHPEKKKDSTNTEKKDTQIQKESPTTKTTGNGTPNEGPPNKKKSPAKCPLVAALAPAVIGAMSKKKE